ncbi:hypothetical protein ACF065_25360 [Streptomyces sp. NPDC015232]|uniref:hypothetical protein n=1 Tax=unclassified Streptomyces TaxID=2593676 RepID=UPI0033C25143
MKVLLHVARLSGAAVLGAIVILSLQHAGDAPAGHRLAAVAEPQAAQDEIDWP